jgi:single-stranded-DNA-specific exonuclease
MIKDWKLKPPVPADFSASFPALHPLLAQLLYNRNITSQNQLDLFMRPVFGKLHDPFLFKDMEKALSRCLRAIESKERILVYGDYDADGVTSAAVMYKTLKFLGADVTVFIPHREKDGYGLNLKNVEIFVQQKTNLLITVDCGITNVNEIKALNAGGVDVIVTDHHEPPAILPEAIALLDPKVPDSGYPFRDLAGAGVAYKFAQALLSRSSRATEAEPFLKWLLDIVAIGTIADVAPLIGENRILAKWGLVVLEKTRNLGLQKLLQTSSMKKIDGYTIGFYIAPRLNAAGRMKHATASFRLLVTQDEEEAERLAAELNENNADRQKVTETSFNLARERFLSFSDENKFLFLVAGKLCEEYYRPVIVMTESAGKIVGSGRSVEGFNITAGITEVSAYLARFGGHSQACGFTLAEADLLDLFQSEFLEKNHPNLSCLNFMPYLEIDAEVRFSEMKLELMEQLQQFEPHGEANDKPLFLMKGITVAAADAIGFESNHLRISAKHDSPKLFKMLWFRKANEWLSRLHPGDTIDAVVELGINEWNGNRAVEVKIVDLKTSK